MQKLVQDVTSDLQMKNLQLNVNIDRDKASALGVTANQVEDALYTAYSQRQISTIYAPNNAYRVVMQLQDAVPARSRLRSRCSTSAQRLASLCRSVPCATLSQRLGRLTVNHLGQLPVGHYLVQPAPGSRIGRRGERGR